MTGRFPASDPRTLARDIPGLVDTLFPHLVPGVVAYLNRQIQHLSGCDSVPYKKVQASGLSRAMLFELAVALAEQLLSSDRRPDWSAARSLAVKRQRRHFDAREPAMLQPTDKEVALQTARNLVYMLNHAQGAIEDSPLIVAPRIPGYQWIASGVGDFAIGASLVEVKCTNRNFSSADYRQVLVYWLLSYAMAVEGGRPEWSRVILLNPRLGFVLTLSFDELVHLLAGGRSKVELLELFATIVGERNVRAEA